MKSSFATTLIAAALAAHPAVAATCDDIRERVRPPEVEFRVFDAEPVIVGDLSSSEITAMNGEGHNDNKGLTTVVLDKNIKADIALLQSSNGTFCAWPVRVAGEVGHSDITIHVAKEYAEGSCEHVTVLEHEMLHVYAAQAALSDGLHAVKADFRDAANLGAVEREGRDEAKAEVLRMLDDALKRSVDANVHAVRQSLDAKIDSPANYMAVRMSCTSW